MAYVSLVVNGCGEYDNRYAICSSSNFYLKKKLCQNAMTPPGSRLKTPPRSGLIIIIGVKTPPGSGSKKISGVMTPPGSGSKFFFGVFPDPGRGRG